MARHSKSIHDSNRPVEKDEPQNHEQNILGPIVDDRSTRLNPTLSRTKTRAKRAGLIGWRGHSTPLAERMAARTVPDLTTGCWNFQGCGVGPNGYGQIEIADGKRGYAHRVAWELANDRKIPVNLRVLHSCDNPRCVNPAHLRLGTQAENVHESIQKGRYKTFGVQKLDATEVLAIRAAVADGESQGRVASRFGIARNTVSQIVNHKTWAHLGATPVHETFEPTKPLPQQAPRVFHIGNSVLEQVPVVQLPVVGDVHA